MKKGFAILLMLGMLMACGSSRQVTRMDSNSVTDLSGKWNETDSRLVAEEMVSDCLQKVWLTDFIVLKGKKPVVTVGTIKKFQQ